MTSHPDPAEAVRRRFREASERAALAVARAPAGLLKRRPAWIAAAYASLEAEHAALVEATTWIPVAERLPGWGKQVLLRYRKCGRVTTAQLTESGEWENDNWHRDVAVDEGLFSHWTMPPKFPEQ